MICFNVHITELSEVTSNQIKKEHNLYKLGCNTGQARKNGGWLAQHLPLLARQRRGKSMRKRSTGTETDPAPRTTNQSATPARVGVRYWGTQPGSRGSGTVSRLTVGVGRHTVGLREWHEDAVANLRSPRQAGSETVKWMVVGVSGWRWGDL
ncbi:hypothetical protein GWI33_003069 [Rhynchophorus ferrugineus]|uniref:Uncharacterized protein n=1 Tax=Rhynchophorus ferrugineus TaxID=354439 RepID=A0A834IJP9_RHYFE|nr:hypothetical protein GWI33_003069 [Rhynchophorus ferrugineus]